MNIIVIHPTHYFKEFEVKKKIVIQDITILIKPNEVGTISNNFVNIN